MTTEAAELHQSLMDVNHPALRDVLAEFSRRIGQAAPASSGAVPAPAEGPTKVAAVPLVHPIWTAPLRAPDWLLAPPKGDAIKVAVFSLADLTRTLEDKSSLAGQNDQANPSPIARSLPLYLTEALRLRSDAASMCVVPIVPRVGPATINAPWPLPNMLDACPAEFKPDYLVCGALTRGRRGAKVELHVFRVRDKQPLKTIRVVGADDFGGVAGGCQQELLTFLAGEGVIARDNDVLPAAQDADGYATCLGHLLVQTLAAGGIIDPARLPNEKGMLESYFKLAEAEAQSPLAALVAIAGVLVGLRYRSRAAQERRGELLEFVDRQSERYAVIRKVAPIVYKALGETERLAAARDASGQNTGGLYADWLAAI
jgi:hypothetical protein